MFGPVKTWKFASMGIAEMSLATRSEPAISILSRIGCLELVTCMNDPNLGLEYPG